MHICKTISGGSWLICGSLGVTATTRYLCSYPGESSSFCFTDPDGIAAGLLSTDYLDDSVVMNKPWKTVFTLGGATFNKVEASLAGTVVYSATSGGEEGGPRADAASTKYNSTTRVVTITFDRFEDGDGGLWSFDFELDKPIEIDVSGVVVQGM